MVAHMRYILSAFRAFAFAEAALAACAVLLAAAPAGATTLQEVGSFGASGIVPAPRNAFRPSRIAIDERTHDVYVIDEGNAAVDRFHADGTFVSQLNPSPSPSGHFTFPPLPDDSDIAVDDTAGPHAGNVYLTDEYFPNNAYAFDAHGRFLWERQPSDPMLGTNWDPCGAAVDPSGLVHITDWYHSSLVALSADGLVQGTLALPFPTSSGTTPCHTAYADNGNLYFAGWLQGLGLYRPGGPFSLVPMPSAHPRAYALAVWNGGLLADVGDELLAYDATGQPLPDSPLLAGAIGSSVGIAVDHSNGRIYVSDTAGRIRVFSTGTSTPPPPPPLPPVIAPPTIGDWVGPVPPFDVPGEQTVHASIDPHGDRVSDCHVEWGPAGASVWSHVPCSPQPGAGDGPANVSAVLSNPYSGVYYFQFIATNGGGTTIGPIHTVVLSGLSDTVAAPAGTLEVSAIRREGTAHVRVTVSCKGASGASCRGTLKLRATFRQRRSHRVVALGRVRYDLHLGRTTIRIPLSPRGRRLVAQHRRLRISALV